MFSYSLLSTYAVEKLQPVALWTTVALFACLITVGFALFFARKCALAKFVKIALIGVLAYLLALAVLFFALDIAKNYSDSYTQENWLDKRLLIKLVLIPLIVFCSLALVGLVVYCLSAKYQWKAKRQIGYAVLSTLALSLIAVIVCLSVYYNRKIVGDGYYNSDTASVKQVALYLSAFCTVAVVVTLALLDKEKLAFSSRAVALAGVCVGMSFALSYIKLWDMPTGGSVTLVSLLPLMIYAYAFGVKKGVVVGLVYGALQAVQDPWIIHPAQFLLDYPIAFSCVGIAGIFKSLPAIRTRPQISFALGAFTAGLFRFICHVLAGALAFEAYAEGQNVWAYSLIYNLYVFIDVALVMVAGTLAFSSKAFQSAIARYRQNA